MVDYARFYYRKGPCFIIKRMGIVEENVFLSEPVSFHRLEHRGVRQITLTCCVSLKPLSGLQITRGSSESGDCKNTILWEIFELSGGEGVNRIYLL